MDRQRTAIQALQAKIASESRKVGTARERESKARQQASRSSSSSSAKSKLREAERRAKEATDAERRRSDLEKQLAAKQKALYQAEAKLDKERTTEHERALKRLENRARRSEQQFRTPPSALMTSVPSLSPAPKSAEAHDVFISYASEDKEEVARPLAEMLLRHQVKVWYDDFSLTIGDSLRRSIDRGLASSRFGVIILSPDFFRKEWPQAELDGLVAKQRVSGSKTVLPIWHRVTKDDVLTHSPMLADLRALNTSLMTMGEIVAEIEAVVTESPNRSSRSGGGDRREAVFAVLGDDLREMVFDGSLRSEIDAVVDDPELAVD